MADARLSQCVVETLSVNPPSPLRATHLLTEVLMPLKAAPITALQVAAELLSADPNEARVTLLCCELIIIPAVAQPKRPCPSLFPVS
jgi:hypothetical protein